MKGDGLKAKARLCIADCLRPCHGAGGFRAAAQVPARDGGDTSDVKVNQRVDDLVEPRRRAIAVNYCIERHMMSETAEENCGWSSDIPWIVLYSTLVLLLMLAWA